MSLFKKNSKPRDKENKRNIKNKRDTPQEIEKVSRIINRTNYSLRLNGISEGIVNDSKVLLDEEIITPYILSPLTELVERCPETKYVPKIKEIIVNLQGQSSLNSHTSKNLSSETEKEKLDTKNVFEVREPLWNLDEVYLPSSTKEQIHSALNIIKHYDTLVNEWGLSKTLKKGKGAVLNFYGPPGTGKSITAEAIAKYLSKKILLVNYADLESKYVGDTPKNIKKAFNQAVVENAVLVFDEADSFLGKRLTNLTQAADYGVNVTRSTMFMEIEQFPGVLIFTTNLIQNYDQAFMRRILANVFFDFPDIVGRKKIWQIHLPDNFPLDKNVSIDLLSSQYEDLTGADIKDAIVTSACMALHDNQKFVTLEYLDKAINQIKSRYHYQKETIEVGSK